MNALAQTFEFDDDDSTEQVEFSFDELSARAKERARDEYRANGIDYSWWDSVYEDADTIAAMMGIEIKRKHHTTHGGQIITGPQIWFSGFSCQGDGACFEGNWYPTKDPLASLSAVMDHAPQDARLHEIALDLADYSERCLALIPEAEAHVEHTGSYYHSGCTRIDVRLPTPHNVDEENEFQRMTWNALVTHHRLTFAVFEDDLKTTLRAFMDWIYRQLNEEHDWLMSDEHIDEALADYTFDEDGNTVG